MANYLPVLLVSVSTNVVPDDSSLTTLPRGQVDYLSHEWEEEDVWRSWRNMTKQKNEITNGVRLENASWRTWWKQRNKLKTISPETLNWLKDSDVTWLYGPLHTAVEWTPVPKPQPVPDSVEATTPASAHDRLDLVSASPKARRPAPHKPILKHRSISQLLTSDFPPTSPLFSPVESEDEQDDVTTANTSANAAEGAGQLAKPLPSSKSWGKRPSLSHTKSDTHVTRWGASRAFRKDSPPRINPPGLDSQANSYFPPTGSTSSSLSQPLSVAGSIRASLSQDSSSSGNGGVTSGGDSRGHHSHGHGQKKKHISFNTFVEQCIAIEKPKKNASGFFGASASEEAGWIDGRVSYIDDDGYEEDEEDSEEEALGGPSGSQWRAGARGVKSDSDSPIEEEDEDDDDDDGIIQIRSSSSSSNTRTYPPQPKNTPRKPPRSQSKVSTASSSSSTSTSTTNSFSSGTQSSSTRGTSTSSPTGSLSPSRRTASNGDLRRKPSSSSSSGRAPSFGSNSTYRPSVYRRGAPPLIRTTSEHSTHVTIAPIAPTLLKTGTGAWSEGLGDEGASDDGFVGLTAGMGWGSLSEKRAGRSPGLNGGGGSEYGSSGGYAFGTGRGGRSFNVIPGDANEDRPGSSDGTPVELVYVPPFGSNYSIGLGLGENYDDGYDGFGGFEGTTEEDEEEEDVQLEDASKAVYHHPPLSGNTGSVGYVGFSGSSAQPIPIASQEYENNLPTLLTDSNNNNNTYRGARQIPTVQREDVDEEAEDAYDFFGGADLGEDYYYARRGGRGYEREKEKSTSVVSAPFVGNPSSNSTLNAGLRNDRDRFGVAPEADSRERRHSRSVGRTMGPPAGEERQSRSRSRSQSRTPSPAFIVSPTISGPVIPTPYSTTTTGRKRSSSASSPIVPGSWITTNGNNAAAAATGSSSISSSHLQHQSSSDRLSPPSRGRQPQPSIETQMKSQSQSQSRGRSSTRTSSTSSSWDRNGSAGGGSLGSSPIGSLSPDSGIRSSGLGAVLGGAAVLAGGGRVDREREKEREREQERGRERRGRDRTSGKMLSASETESLGKDDANSVNGTVVSATESTTSVADSASVSNSNSNSSRTVTEAKSAMDASFYSVASSSSSGNNSNNSTIMGAPTVVPTGAAEDQEIDIELQYLRRAEEEQRRRVHPTPSNSPVTTIRAMPPAGVGESFVDSTSSTPKGKGSSSGGTTPTGASTSSSPLSDATSAPTSVGSFSNVRKESSRTPSPAHTHTRVPSGGISASQPSPSKLRPPPLVPSPPLPVQPRTSFTAVSSPMSPTTASNASLTPAAPPAAAPVVSPTVASEPTIVSKAVGVVSSAGAFFGLWGGQ